MSLSLKFRGAATNRERPMIARIGYVKRQTRNLSVNMGLNRAALQTFLV